MLILVSPIRFAVCVAVVLAAPLSICKGEATTGGGEDKLLASVQEKIAHLAPPPRLFATDKAWKELPGRIQSDPVMASIYQATRKRAEAVLSCPLLVHKKEGRRQLTVARLFLARMLDLCTVARVENDPRFAERARQELLLVANLPDWDCEHFLDVAEYALGVSIGLDWLHDYLSAEERELVVSALINRAIMPSFPKPGENPWFWVSGKSNWTQVCHAGLAAAALMIAEKDPALATRTIVRAIRAQQGLVDAYAPDGAYVEGPTYWAYGTTFHVILASLLNSTLGEEFGVTDVPGFLASADYMAQVTAPSGRYFDYSDSREESVPAPALHWFAARRGLPGIAEPELIRLKGERRGVVDEYDKTVQQQVERLDALALWWYQPAAMPKEQRQSWPTAWRGRGKNPVAVFRTRWDDPQASFIAFKGGSPSGPHAHMDAGGFVFEAEGVRWAIDPGMQNYRTLESANIDLWNMGQHSPRWQVFRLGPSAHNILRFNGAEQLVSGSAVLTSFSPDRGVSLDLTPLYASAARGVHRTGQLQPNGTLVISDEWTCGESAVKVTWQWLTFAEVTATENGALLSQNGKTLELRIKGSQKWALSVVDCAKELKPYDAPNPGLKRIEICVPTLGNQSASLRVEAIPGKENGAIVPPHQ